MVSKKLTANCQYRRMHLIIFIKSLSAGNTISPKVTILFFRTLLIYPMVEEQNGRQPLLSSQYLWLFLPPFILSGQSASSASRQLPQPRIRINQGSTQKSKVRLQNIQHPADGTEEYPRAGQT